MLFGIGSKEPGKRRASPGLLCQPELQKGVVEAPMGGGLGTASALSLTFGCSPAGVGSLLARFQLAEGPSSPAPLAVQFTSEGSTLSSCDIELVGAGYRFSLIKKRFAAGRCQPFVNCHPLGAEIPPSGAVFHSWDPHVGVSGGSVGSVGTAWRWRWWVEEAG